jgi:hypothetical protein
MPDESPVTATGTGLSAIVLLLPSSPKKLNPQHCTPPAALSAHVCAFPPATAVYLAAPDSGVPLALAPLLALLLTLPAKLVLLEVPVPLSRPSSGTLLLDADDEAPEPRLLDADDEPALASVVLLLLVPPHPTVTSA